MSEIVPVDVPPAEIVDGSKVKLAKLSGVIVSDADETAVPWDAVIFAAIVLVTALVDTENVVDDAWAGTITDLGILATVELLLMEILSPPDGAGPLNVTVAVEVDPPATVLGFS